MGYRRGFHNRGFATVASVLVLLAAAREVPGIQKRISSQTQTKPGLSPAGKTRSTASRPAAPRTHTVRQGDTLYSIARRYSTSVKALQATNNLEDSRLKIGQVLRLTPGTAARSRAAAARQPARPLPQWPQPTARESFTFQHNQSTVSPNDIVSAQHLDPLEPTSPGPGMTDSEASTLSLKRLQLIGTGFGFVGVRYRWNGMSEKTGFDCSGLVKKLFDEYGINLPRSAREQFKEGVEVAAANLELGDLVFFGRNRTPTHVGIYIGERCILHALSGSRRVIVSDLDHSWYKRRFLGARRIPGLWEDSLAYERRLGTGGTR